MSEHLLSDKIGSLDLRFTGRKLGEIQRSRAFSNFVRPSYNRVIDSVLDGSISSEGLSDLKRLVGDENVLAECSGVNYNIYVTQSRLLVGKRFTLGESIVNVPHTNVSTLELITKSIIPTLTLAILAGTCAALVWWFPGQQRVGLPLYPYDYAVVGIGAIFIGALVGTWWRRRVAVLRIGIVGNHDPITVKLVSSSKAASVFRALKD